MAFVNPNMERRLASLVSGVDVSAAGSAATNQQIDDGWLVPEGGVMDRPVAIFVLDLKIAVVSGKEDVVGKSETR